MDDVKKEILKSLFKKTRQKPSVVPSLLNSINHDSKKTSFPKN